MMNDGNCTKCGKYAGDCICPDGVASGSLERAGSVASAIVDAIRELDRHIENQKWSSNSQAIADRERLIAALIDMGKPLNTALGHTGAKTNTTNDLDSKT